MVSPVRKYDYTAAMDQQLMVPPLRRNPASPNTNTYWVEFGSCQSSPAELFEPAFGAGSMEKVTQANEDKFAHARGLCNECPIWHICYLKATSDDFYYTMRAGIEPVQFTEYKERGRLNYKSTQRSAHKATCKRGHNNWKLWGKKRPRRKCVTCDSMSTEEKAQFDRTNAID